MTDGVFSLLQLQHLLNHQAPGGCPSHYHSPSQPQGRNDELKAESVAGGPLRLSEAWDGRRETPEAGEAPPGFSGVK